MSATIPDYKNAAMPVDRRVGDLLARMTLEEKIGQLNQTFCGWNAYRIENGTVVLTAEFEQTLRNSMAGAVYGMHRSRVIDKDNNRDVSPREGARAVNEVQRIALEHSRHGIPLLVSEECPKGYYAPGATVLPSPILYGSSWNRALLFELGRMVARETRAGGGTIGYGPVLDICHDPRWSRIEEGFGEDPFLTGELGAAMVEGFQGDDLSRPDAVAATLKHFAAYGTTEGGRNTAPAHLGQRELREMHLPPFERAVKAGALSVMCSYNEIDGVPVASDQWLLTDLLRGEWGFEGLVVSDALAIDELCVANGENSKHRVAPTLVDASALALRAGVDLSLWDKAYLHLADAVRCGKVTEAVVDRAAGRVLRAKFLLGLFEKPFVDEERAPMIIGAPHHRRLSRRAAEESLVLLKNSSTTLPLRKSSSIAVIGPNARNLANLLGTYTPSPIFGTTIFEGIQRLAAAPELVRYALGCRVKDPSKSAFDEAIALAQECEIVVAVVGGSSTQDETVKLNAAGQTDLESAGLVNDIDCGENVDRDDIGLSGVQTDLLRALKALGKPLVVVLVQGRPHEINWIAENADAVLCAWYPGPEGGEAIGRVLFGDVNPSGKLTISFPKSVGQIPVNYNHKPSAEKRYLNRDTKPLYPFGFGLSYTSFAYRNLSISPARITAVEKAAVTVEVTNTGERAGHEITQLYLRDDYASVTRPVQMLRGFQRIELLPGETKTVRFEIDRRDLSLWDRRMELVVEPGTFTVMVGGSSVETISKTFEVL